jgi:hypothetical protein
MNNDHGCHDNMQMTARTLGHRTLELSKQDASDYTLKTFRVPCNARICILDTKFYLK